MLQRCRLEGRERLAAAVKQGRVLQWAHRECGVGMPDVSASQHQPEECPWSYPLRPANRACAMHAKSHVLSSTLTVLPGAGAAEKLRARRVHGGAPLKHART